MKMAFGQMLAEELRKRNMTQSDLARIANVGKDRVSYYVRGGQPRAKTMVKLAKALGMTQAEMQEAMDRAAAQSESHDSSSFSISETDRNGWMEIRFIGCLPRAAALKIASVIVEAKDQADKENPPPNGRTTPEPQP